MSDKEEIRELLARYCFALDAERFEEMAALFTEDGVWETAFGTGTGRSGIVAQARRIAVGPRPRRVHLTTNIVIDLAGDAATARSNWVLFQNSHAGPAISSGGAYADRLVKRDGRWFFQHRAIDRYVAAGKDADLTGRQEASPGGQPAGQPVGGHLVGDHASGSHAVDGHAGDGPSGGEGSGRRDAVSPGLKLTGLGME